MEGRLAEIRHSKIQNCEKIVRYDSISLKIVYICIIGPIFARITFEPKLGS